MKHKTVRRTQSGRALASAGPRYYRAVDLMLAAVSFAKEGKAAAAAQMLMKAAQDQEVDQAMQQLDGQQQDWQQQMDQNVVPEQQAPADEQQMAKVLSRLMAAAIKHQGPAVLADSDEDQDQEDDDEDGDGDEETADTDEDDSVQDDMSGLDAEFDNPDDMSIDLGDQEPEDEQGEMAVRASVKARLARAERNKARRQAA